MAFVLLPKEKRDGMSALYAFCRQVDDVADEQSLPLSDRRTLLQAWRRDIQAACDRKPVESVLCRELQPFVERYHLPFALFDEMIRGVEMDLDIQRYETYDQLEVYCYRVASVVGLLSIEIFGYQDPVSRDYAVLLGKALQFTNILRDVRRDAELGRIYLPISELRRFSVEPEEILSLRYSQRFGQLAASVANRAIEFYKSARQTLPAVDRRAMAPAELMASVYWRLLQKLQRRQFDVFQPAVTRLSRCQKLSLVLRTWWRLLSGHPLPTYGAP